MEQRDKKEAPSLGAQPGDGAGGGTGNNLPPLYHEAAPCVNRQFEPELERELAAFWTACDRHAYPEADQHAARYRALVHGQRAGDLDARLAALELAQAQSRRALDDLERRLYGLEGGDYDDPS